VNGLMMDFQLTLPAILLTFAFAATAVVIGEITRLLGIGGGIQGMVPQFFAQIAGRV